MKASFLTLVAAAAFALAAPTATLQSDGDYCDKNDHRVTGDYTIYNNLWGQDKAWHGFQCTGIDGLNGATVQWHTKWTWAGNRYEVKSYANANTNIAPKALSSIKFLHSSWSWYYTGHELIANAAYDMFTASTASGSSEFEIMIWLSSLGGAMPISASGKPIADVNIAGSSWKLYDGWNGQMRVYSFVAASNMNNSKADVMEFLRYMISNQGLPANQILQSVHAGTEAFMGYDAVFTTSGYTLSQR